MFDAEHFEHVFERTFQELLAEPAHSTLPWFFLFLLTPHHVFQTYPQGQAALDVSSLVMLDESIF